MLQRRIIWLQRVTLAWMVVECGVALAGAWAAHSPALLAFGADSLVELLSAGIVLLQFMPGFRLDKHVAAQATGWLLFALAGIVAVIAMLGIAGGYRPESTVAGMGITAAALVVMPVLAGMKRSAAQKVNNRALAADAVQSATCAYLAGITLAGLALNAIFGIAWFDDAAALLAIPILILEGRRALRGESCGCAGGASCAAGTSVPEGGRSLR